MAGVLIGGSLLAMTPRRFQNTGHFADAGDAGIVAAGRILYRQRCASCHGRSLQGQPLWQLADEYRGRRAPAHDQTGHTWLHSDEDLFQMTKFGRFGSAPPAGISAMPPFANSMSDADIISVIAFIKATWPVAMRVVQAGYNPDGAGMPRGNGAEDWTFPANCVPGHRPAAERSQAR